VTLLVLLIAAAAALVLALIYLDEVWGDHDHG
jgi:hypothetical protein